MTERPTNGLRQLQAEVRALRLDFGRLNDDDHRKRLRMAQAAIDNLEAECRKLREQVAELQKLKASMTQAIADWKAEAERQADSRAPLLNEKELLEATIARVEALLPPPGKIRRAIECEELRAALRGEP
jgi:multidrug resistance efflux pump